MTTSINLNEFSTEHITFGTSKLMPSGGKSIPLSYKQNDSVINVVFVTPRMLSFGINSWCDPKNHNSEPVYSITMSFLGMENNTKLAEFHKVISLIDEWALDAASKNSWDWISRKNLSIETIKSIYNPCIKISLDSTTGLPNDKPHSIKIKIKATAKDGGFQTTFFDKEKNVIPGTDIEKVFNIGSYTRAMIQCTGFWSTAGKVGLSWKILQMIVEPRISIRMDFKEYAFTDEE
jgi:hypothetical protein